mgnify:CR=1 FL=1
MIPKISLLKFKHLDFSHYIIFLDGDDFYCDKDFVKDAINMFTQYSNISVFAFNFKYLHTNNTEEVFSQQMTEGITSLGQRKYWANEHEMTGTAGHYLKDNKIDGIVTLNAFGCGPDSLMIERIMRKAKEAGKPMLSLTIDEHTGEAGFITRLEAFIDMLYRKKRTRRHSMTSDSFGPLTYLKTGM